MEKSRANQNVIDDIVEQKSRVDQNVVADIMNRINEALNDIGYVAIGYDNSDIFLNVIIDKVTMT